MEDSRNDKLGLKGERLNAPDNPTVHPPESVEV